MGGNTITPHGIRDQETALCNALTKNDGHEIASTQGQPPQQEHGTDDEGGEEKGPQEPLHTHPLHGIKSHTHTTRG